MEIFKNKLTYPLNNLLIAIVFIKLFFITLSVGGRWDLNEQIAFATRLFNGVAYYANGIDDLFPPSSPYFPGVGFISYFLQICGLDNLQINEIVMLLIAVLIGLSYFILLFKVTRYLYPEIEKKTILLFLTLIYSTGFRSYLSYMIEFKPDTILLVISMIIFLLIERKKRLTYVDISLSGLFLFIATFFKQSSFLIYLFTFILICTKETLTKKDKVILIFIYSVIALIALTIIFSIDNLYYFTVHVMSLHPFQSLYNCLKYWIYIPCKNNFIFIISLIYFFWIRYKKISFYTNEGKYLLFAMMWFIFAIISAAKVGGNDGNTEVGLIVFAPFVIYSVNNILKSLGMLELDIKLNYSLPPNKLHTHAISLNCSKVINIILCCLIVVHSSKAFIHIIQTIVKINHDSATIYYLRDKFAGKKAFIDGNTYIVSQAANLEILTEAETIGHFNNIPNYNMSHLKRALKTQIYDLIFLKHDINYFKDKEILRIISEKYMIYKDRAMPGHLYNKILIPKPGD